MKSGSVAWDARSVPQQRSVQAPATFPLLPEEEGNAGRAQNAAVRQGAAVPSPKTATPSQSLPPITGARASGLIDQKIAELDDWRGATLSRLRALMHEAVPAVEEELKWMGTPVWSSKGILCTGETYKQVVTMTFAKGASLPDPAQLFNSSLDGNTRRAIDVREGEALNEEALKALFRAAAELNAAGKR